MTDKQRLRVIDLAAKAGADAMILTEKACVSAIVKEDLENEDAERVIEWFCVGFSEGAREIMRRCIIETLNEGR